MRVSVLGAVSVAEGDLEVSGHALGGRRVRLAIVALALADGPIPSERLASMIWGDELPASWKPALRGLVRSIRTAVAALSSTDQQLVATAPSGYALGSAVEVDVREASAALDAAVRQLADSRPDVALQLLLPAAELATDQFLATEDLDWVETERRSLTELRRSARETLVTAAGLTGDNRRAVRTARELVADDPTDESAHRTLIAALDRAGDRVGAVQAYEVCRNVLADQLGIDPSGETVSVYLAALRSSAPVTVGHLPEHQSTFVGREGELHELTTATSESRLVTLVGRGGIGKSRLALAFASTVRDGETLWVQLGSSTNQELVAADVARGLGASPEPDPIAALIATIAPRGRTLLVLDGCDEIADGVATLAASLLAGCPELTLVCTSRGALRLPAERVLSLGPMDTGSTSEPGQATRLLARRIGELGAAPEGDSPDYAALQQLANRAHGIPLALELLAAQLREISLNDLLDDMAESEVGDQLRTILDYGYSALTEDEASVFRRISVLDGAVALGLVRGLVASARIPSTRVARLLGELTTRGLLTVDQSGARWRYEQHDDVRDYARELLLASGEEAGTFVLLSAALRSMLPEDARLPPAPFTVAITEVLPSIRSLFGAALDGRASMSDAQEIAFRLHRYYAATSVSEGRFWLSRLLATDESTAWTGLATFALGYLSYWAADGEAAFAPMKTAVELLRGVEDSYVARGLIFLGGIADDLNRGDEAVDFVKEAIAISERLGEHNVRVGATVGVGSLLAERGDASAVDFAQDAIALCREVGTPEQLLITLPTAAMIAWQVGDNAAARAFAEEARPLLEDEPRIARMVLLTTMAGLALAEGDPADAVRLASAADADGTELGVERELPLVRCVLAHARLANGDVDGAAEAATSALASTSTISIDYPLALCLETAALVAREIGATDTELASVLQSATIIREAGSRPTAAGLAGSISRLRAGIGRGQPLSARDAADLASRMLSRRVRT
ncbi:MAG TPA: BTAD domain-containing putative transcriptional regulator [Galbitalea sp.]|nr:BTAD domain-containing putative transcriptional regulator [Galbitalea sp.]